MAAAAGNAPALPVSETGVQTSTLSGKMVAREGAAPPISGCRPDVILFHHRAKTGCRGWTRTTTLAFKGRCPAIRRPGKKVVEPEVVATSPNRIKSPVPVCCGFSSRKVVLAAGFAPALATFSTSCLFCWTTRANNWSLQPVMLRHDDFTKVIRRLLHGGEMVAIPSAALGGAGL